MTGADLRIAIPAGFSLAESSAFLRGFRAIAGSSSEMALDLAFALDDGWEPVGVHAANAGDALAIGVLSNRDDAPAAQIRQNVARILSLHVDDAGYDQIGRRDPVAGHLQRQYPGLRPVLFPTAWEAAVWSILSQRTRRAQAITIKERLSEQYGHAVVCPNGATLHGFPGPATVLGIPEIRGISIQKMEWLRFLAEAALRGELDCGYLASLPQDQGMTALQALPGIGPFSAELILARGAGNPDIFPMNEPMLHEKMTRLYGESSPERHRQIADAWRPFRSWISLLVRIGH